MADVPVTFVAPDVATFIVGLIREEELHDEEETRRNNLLSVQHGTLLPIVVRALEAGSDQLPEGERAIRALGAPVVAAKGFVALHAHETSCLLYDAVFWLYSHLATARSGETYKHPCYES